MNTTTVKEVNEVQDYTNIGYGFVNNYTKIYTTTDGNESWNTGRVKSYSFTVNGIESKRYNTRGWAVKAMFKSVE